MKFSEKWLREFVNPAIDSETLMHQLTMAGLEVDGVMPACQKFDGLVVAEVVSLQKHPDADKLQVCQVNYGEKETITIVCGAANVRAGMRTVLAKVGAQLPGKPELVATPLKGVVSHGMLCSAREIGLGDDHEGIIELSANEAVGKSLADIVDVNDSIIEISLTPNRGDCLSIKGIAREVAVCNQLDLVMPEYPSVEVRSSATRQVKSNAVMNCPRYLGRIIEDIDATVKTPLWLSEKLRRSGIRSINIVVDITNFVMLELGQPMHAFDNDYLQGDIVVRFAKDKERIKLLDESEVDIKPKTLLITDDSGPLAMAGLMGGFDSAVSTTTKNVFLESAFFTPDTIIGEARQYGMHTDSSHRFERGVDPELQLSAIERATSLLIALCGGNAGPITEAVDHAALPTNQQVILRQAQIERVLGVDLDDQFVTDTFIKLGMTCQYNEEQWFTTPPSHRFDINIEVDLVEELARIYSYDAIPASLPKHTLKMRWPNKLHESVKHLSEVLINRDYSEVITYSFVDPKQNNLLNDKYKKLSLANPIAPELSEMRSSLLPGLLSTLQYNIKRQQERVRIFETGLVFTDAENLKQEPHVGGLIYGNIYIKQWDEKIILCDFYDLKCDIETLLYSMMSMEEIEMSPSKSAFLHPGQAVDVLIDGAVAGYFGRIHPQIGTDLNISDNVYLFEFNLKKIRKKEKRSYQAISKYPSIKRDIAIVLDKSVALADVMHNIKSTATNLLTNLELFDLYEGEGIEKEKKSLALGLTFQATSSTLKDEEVETIMRNVIDGLHNNFGAKLRE